MRYFLIMSFFVSFFYGSLSVAKVELITSGEGKALGLRTHQEQAFSSDKKISLSSTEPILLEFADRIPVLLVPISEGGEIKVDSPTVSSVLSKNTEEQASKLLSPLIFEFVQIQDLIKQKHLKEAEEKIVVLKNRYPNVAFLDFVWGSILALNGNREAAKTAVQRALASHPDYEEGKIFLKSLEGESR